ncbi:MAG TPA: aminoglycoside phosphotransferase family protein [Solirubrobacteraceae bacterium]|nr:aminoglycoside phosphotransferase family protein [Solirubrobacteraceae bacterium]
MAIRIPRALEAAVDADELGERRAWLAALPGVVAEIAGEWGLTLGDPYSPGGQCAWVAPADDDLVLKVSWRHTEAEHEADGLRFWNGDGTVRCFAARSVDPHTTALLLERCMPGMQLKTLPEPEQDELVAALARRLHRPLPGAGHPFRSLTEICDGWAGEFEQRVNNGSLERALAREAVALFRELPRTARSEALLCTDLHAGNVLSSEREPWLVIDPKPLIGDPAFDAVQHMLNCDERLATDPMALAARMGSLLEVDSERVRLWLFARCAQESADSAAMVELARRLAP